MSALTKYIEIEELTKSNNPNSIPHFVGNEVFEVAGWTVPPLYKKEQAITKEEIINRLKKLMEDIINIVEQSES